MEDRPPETPAQELERLRRERANFQLFARMIAHDLNNVLGGVLGHASLIEALAEQGGEIQSSSAVIAEGAERATGLARQLLQFAGETMARMEAADLARIVGEVGRLLSSREGGGLRVRTRIESAPALVTGDPAQLYQMVLNLAVNARDAMPEGGEVRLRVSRPREGRIGLVVSDEGPGIPAELLGRIFEPFVSGSAQQHGGQGRGLGLAIVRRVVESHGGSIEVASRPGEGAVFSVELPEARRF
jgi:signal transduction histidine kinase